MMDTRQKSLMVLCFVLCFCCLSLLTASLVTQQWIVAKPVNLLDSSVLNVGETDGKLQGDVRFGLFHGKKILNYPLGPRISTFSMKAEASQSPMLMFPLWAGTVVCVGVALLFGLVAAVFAVVNAVISPVETITGPAGLYLWNGIALALCIAGMVTWCVNFALRLRYNVMSVEERENGWSSDGRATLGPSFFCVSAAAILFTLNMFLVFLTRKRPWAKPKTKYVAPKNPQGAIMLY